MFGGSTTRPLLSEMNPQFIAILEECLALKQQAEHAK